MPFLKPPCTTYKKISTLLRTPAFSQMLLCHIMFNMLLQGFLGNPGGGGVGLANEDLEEEGEEIFWVTVCFKYFTISPDHSLIKRNFIKNGRTALPDLVMHVLLIKRRSLLKPPTQFRVKNNFA